MARISRKGAEMQGYLRVFIGWDPKQAVAYDVARYSLVRHSSITLEVIPLKQSELRESGMYWRPRDPLASTEFTYTRFLVPYLAEYAGFALFFDCDFLWLDDIGKLLEHTSDDFAVACVKHDYAPKELTKMGGLPQTTYPRKNWSSLMLFNCEHTETISLTPEVVNTASPQFLHRFGWANDSSIGSLPVQWNWLEGWYDESEVASSPSCIHYTRGGPWLPGCEDVGYSELWLAERDRMATDSDGF